MNGTQYPWPSARVLRAAQKEVGRHGKGAGGGRGGQFAKKEVPKAGIKEIDHAKRVYGEYNIMRVKVAKLERRVREGDDDAITLQNLRFAKSDKAELKGLLDKAKVDALQAGYKIDSRGNAKKIDTQKLAKVDSPRNDLVNRIREEKALLGTAVKQKRLGTGGSLENPMGTEKLTADNPILCELKDGSYAVRKLDGTSKFSHAHSEVIASRMSALLGVGNVPVTAMYKHDRMDGNVSSQRFIEGSEVAVIEISKMAGGNTSQTSPKFTQARSEYGKKYKEQLIDMYALDSMIGNVDRHNGNIVQKGGKLYGIDNGRSVVGWSDSTKRIQDMDIPDTNGNVRYDVANSANRFFDMGITKNVPIRQPVLDRWNKVKKSDFEMVYKGLGVDIDIDAQWDYFANIRKGGQLIFY